MWGRAGLIGDTGFVGGALARQVSFARAFNSRSIRDIAGEHFDTLVCAGAPATMWAANANPKADSDNLLRLQSALSEAKIERLILISTIAVFDDSSAGYTESNARYETTKAYGRHRRELELHVFKYYDAVVLRLPALFGSGLKKNFIFDILNPIPSFIKPEKFAEIRNEFTSDELRLADEVFTFDRELGMHKLDRAALKAGGNRHALEGAFERAGFNASKFTNSDSHYQYYNLANLRRDIETCVTHGLTTLNICSEPWQAGDLHKALTGTPFANSAPPVVKEDVRTEHAAAFGRSESYLYNRSDVLRELQEFVSAGNL
jgi:hypothetical protein